MNPKQDTYVEMVVNSFEEHRNKQYDKKIERGQKNPFNPSDPGENYLNPSAELQLGCKFVDTKY